MKIFTIVSSFVLVLGSVQVAQAGSRHGHQGYKQSDYSAYKHGGIGWLKSSQGHKPRHHGHKPKRYNNRHHGYRHGRRGYGHSDDYFLGGLFFGALLGHAITSNSYGSETSYTTHSTTTYEPSAMPPATSSNHGRLVLGVDGSCTLVSSDADGNEIHQPLAPSECHY